MKKYIERYIHAVTRRLKESSRLDVSQELSAHIYDMLPENPTDEQIEHVLKSLGNPRKLANNYQTDQHYVISPLYYYDYINTLKIVLTLVFAAQIVFGTIGSLTSLQSDTLIGQFVEVMAGALSNAFSSLFPAFAWVTIIFWITDYNMRKRIDEWSIKDLPELPRPETTKISSVETIIGLTFHVVFSALFIGLFLNYTELLVINIDGEFITDIFNQTIVSPFLPYFIISALLGVGVALLKLVVREWRISIAISHTIYEIISSILFIIFIRTPNLIKSEVFDIIASYSDYSVDQVLNGFSVGINVATWIVLIILAIDLVFTWIKTTKGCKGTKINAE